MQSIDFKLKSRIYGGGRGAAFTPNDFLDIGARDAVDKICFNGMVPAQGD